MKKVYYIIVVALTIIFQSCEGYLDRIDLSNLTSDSFFKNETDVKQFIDGFYSSFVQIDGLDFATDINALNPQRMDASYSDIAIGTFSPTSSSIGKYWDYSSIRNAYVLFDKIGKVEMSEDSRNLYIGSTQYLLAYRYFVMFRAYEGVPIVREVLTVDKADIGSSSKEEVYAEALKQVSDAITNLPSLGPQERERGRLTKLCALTLKADMVLYAASRFKGEISGASWEDAVTAAQAALSEADSKGYGLASNYENLFVPAYQASADNQKEVILEKVGIKGITSNSYFTYDWRPRHDQRGVAGYCATQELVDMYECIDGKPIKISPLYDPTHPFANRDQRLTNTILYPGNIPNTVDPGDKWLANSLDPSESNYDYMLCTWDTRDAPISGYVNIKYWDRDVKAEQFGLNYTSYIIYRYAEILLVYAEAKNELSGPDASVYSAISKIRERSGMPGVSSSTHPTKAAVRALICNERTIELQGESKRYWDVRRWGIGEEVQNKSFYTMHISKFNADGSSNGYMDQIYVRTSLTDPTQEALFSIPNGTNGGNLMTTGGFDGEKYYVWPLPQGAINASSSGALKQHSLWK